MTMEVVRDHLSAKGALASEEALSLHGPEICADFDQDFGRVYANEIGVTSKIGAPVPAVQLNSN